MRQQISFLTQSRFYSPAFNAAIFDGPVRIYFAQYQEAQALKVYFNVQQRLKDINGSSNTRAREAFRRMGVNIFIMLYPNLETFQISFEGVTDNGLPQNQITASSILVDKIGPDHVVGAAASLIEKTVDEICNRIYEITSELVVSASLPTVAVADGPI